MAKEKIMTIKYYILVGLLLLSLFVALIYNKKVNHLKNVTKVTKTETKTEAVKPEEVVPAVPEDLPLDSDIVKELGAKVHGFDTVKAGSYYGYFYKQDYLDQKGISDDAKIAIGITQNANFSSDFINATYEAVAPDGTKLNVIILAKEEIDEGINSFLGPSTTYQTVNLADAETAYCGFSGFKFDETRNVYMNNPISCTGFPQDYIDTKLIKATQIGDILELTYKIAYIKYDVLSADSVIKNVYRNNGYNFIEKHDILIDNSYEIDNILNKLDSFKFTFKLHSNNYFYFEKVEKIK